MICATLRGAGSTAMEASRRVVLLLGRSVNYGLSVEVYEQQSEQLGYCTAKEGVFVVDVVDEATPQRAKHLAYVGSLAVPVK